jgi:pimeloyl-ACP methyl ester carboxylesterase
LDPDMPASSEAAPVRVDQAFFAPIRGARQWVTLRGADAANPALLILSGPGVALSAIASYFAPWEADFTLVHWDQPGAGATHAPHGNPTLSLGRLAADAAAVAEIACARLGVRRLAVLGVSGGSIIGLRLAKARPDLVAAYVGTGQIVHWARQEALAYRMALDAATARGDAAAIAELQGIGPPPYPEIERELVKSKYVTAPTAAERAAFAAMPPQDPAGRERATVAYLALRGEIAAFDAWALGPAFEVPMLFLQGSDDLYTPTAAVAAYAAGLAAPDVLLETIPGGGHSAVFLRELFLGALKTHLRPRLRTIV